MPVSAPGYYFIWLLMRLKDKTAALCACEPRFGLNYVSGASVR